MNKGICILCGAVLVISISLAEGAPLLCHHCEEKKQLHIEVHQPTSVTQQVASTAISGISDTATTTTMPPTMAQDEMA